MKLTLYTGRVMKVLTHEQIASAVGLPLEKIEELAEKFFVPRLHALR